VRLGLESVWDEPPDPLKVDWLGPSLGLVAGEVDLRDWFSAQELEPCPSCGEASALPTPSGGFRICLSCGLLKPDGTRVTDLRDPLDGHDARSVWPRAS
jgi:hypothetical protein